jgi:hypothetical protein
MVRSSYSSCQCLINIYDEYRVLSRWLGFTLMNIGEMGNFISYGFAPASVVAPLGTVSTLITFYRTVHAPTRIASKFALIANCVFAPIMLKESFRKVRSTERLVLHFSIDVRSFSEMLSELR